MLNNTATAISNYRSGIEIGNEIIAAITKEQKKHALWIVDLNTPSSPASKAVKITLTSHISGDYTYRKHNKKLMIILTQLYGAPKTVTDKFVVWKAHKSYVTLSVTASHDDHKYITIAITEGAKPH